MDEDLLKSIQSLIDSNIGDKGRLEFIKESISKGKTLYNSDKKYLDSMLSRNAEDVPNEKIEDITEDEIPIDLDKLRKSQPKPKYKTKPTKFGVSYSNSGRGSAKIHMNSCRHVQRSSQEGDIKWSYFSDYPDAKYFAQTKSSSQSYGWKYAECCLNGHIRRITTGAIFLTLFFGIIGALIGWYITKSYHPTGSKVILSIGTITTIVWLGFSLINNFR